MKQAMGKLLNSRKFLVVLATQVLIAVLTYFGKLDTDTATKIAAALVGAWMAAHAYQEGNAP
jgi:uncharacterized protein involved in cysteine biosynthesis